MILLSALHEQQHPCFDMWIFTRVFVFIISHTCTLSPLDYLQLCCLMSTCLDSSVFFLLLIFSLSPLWPENSFYMILIYLNVLKFVLWPRIWFILTKCLMDTLNMCVYWFSTVLSHFLMASTLSNEKFAVIRVETFMVVSHFSLVITEMFFLLVLSFWPFIIVCLRLNVFEFNLWEIGLSSFRQILLKAFCKKCKMKASCL